MPAVGARGLALAASAQHLLASKVAEAALRAPPTVNLDSLNASAIVVLPAYGHGADMRFLLPASGDGQVLGRASPHAPGLMSADRKAVTDEAEALTAPIFGKEGEPTTPGSVRCVPITWLTQGKMIAARCASGESDATGVRMRAAGPQRPRTATACAGRGNPPTTTREGGDWMPDSAEHRSERDVGKRQLRGA